MSTIPPDQDREQPLHPDFDGIQPDETIRLSLFSEEPSHRPRASGLILGNQIGRGGVGEIYEAVQPTLNRIVAVKVLHDTERATLPRMFQNEAYITARLNHPNILPVHDMVLVDGVPALIMKRVYGRSWENQILTSRKDGSFRLQPNIRTLINVCRAVDYAHAQGVLHLDLKPANVMVGEFGETLVMDWGCATIFDDHIWIDEDHLPRTHAIQKPVGTPRFLSPEQARGDGSSIGIHTDVFLLGAMLRMLLTEEPMRSGTTANEMILEAAGAQPPPLPDSGPVDLLELCKKALDVDPSQRVASAAEFKHHLEEWLDGREARSLIEQAQRDLRSLSSSSESWTASDRQSLVQTLGLFEQAARLPGAVTRAQKGANDTRVLLAEKALQANEPGFARSFIEALPDDHIKRDSLLAEMNQQLIQQAAQRRSHQRIRWIIAGTIMALIAAFITTGSLYLQSEESRVSAEMAQIEAEAALQFSGRMLESVDPDVSKGLDTTLVEKMMETAVRNAHVEFVNQPKALASVLEQVSSGHFYLGQYKESAEIQHRAVELLRSAYGSDSEEFLWASYTQGTNLHRSGKIEIAKQLLEDCAKRAKANNLRQIESNCRHTLAQVYADQGSLDAALATVNQAIQIENEEVGLVSLNKIRMLNTRSQIYASRNELELAATDIEGVVQARINLLGEDNYETSTAYLNLGVVRRKQDRLEEAIDLYDKTLQIRTRLSGADHPRTLTIFNNMGTAYRSGGANKRAIESFQTAYTGRQKALGTDHMYTVLSGVMLADELAASGRTEEAEQILEENNLFDPEWSSENEQVSIIVLSSIANLKMAQKKWKDARLMLEKVSQIPAVQNSAPNKAWTELRHAYTSQMLGQTPPTKPILKHIETTSNERGAAHCITMIAAHMGLIVLEAQGQLDEATSVRSRIIKNASEALSGPTPLGIFVDASKRCLHQFESGQTPN